MRKIILLILFAFVATSSMAFGAEETWRPRLQQRLSPQIDGKTMVKQRTTREEARANLLPKKEQIKNNHLQEQQLKREVAIKVHVLQSHIKTLKKDRTLTPEKLTLIKKTLNKVKADLNSLRGTAGGIAPKIADFKVSIRNRDLPGAEANLDGILSVQQQRIALLQSLLASLNNLQECL